MKITTVRSGRICRIKFEGMLSIEAVAQTKADVMAVLTRKGAVELDLSDVSDCDTAGVQLLLMLRAEVRARGQEFTTTSLSPPLLRLMQSVGLATAALVATGS